MNGAQGRTAGISSVCMLVTFDLAYTKNKSETWLCKLRHKRNNAILTDSYILIAFLFNRVNYVKFLEPYAKHRRGFRHGHNMQAVMKHPQAELVWEESTFILVDERERFPSIL